jgi:serpin B
MNGAKAVAMALLVLTAGRLGCARAAPEGAAPGKAEEPPVRAVVEAGNRFALGLYGELRGAEGNLFLSPYSISSVLSMAYAGARGETAEQMAQVLHLPEEGGEVHAAMGRLAAEVAGSGREREFALHVANAVWLQQGFEVLAEFLRVMSAHYGGGLERLDFGAAPEPARRRINAWVEEQTAGRIRDIIPPGVLTPLTRLVLTNAIYFKGAWLHPFSEGNTADDAFHVTAERSVTVPMMKGTHRCGYAESGDVQVLKMGYVGGEVSMTIVLPRRVGGLAELEESLTPETLAAWSELERRRVAVTLPRFKVTAQCRLDRALQQLGMTDAFTERADLSGITGRRDLFVSAVLHKAFVDVDEEGTEAAAATALVATTTAVRPGEPPVFRADHPFLFYIQHEPTGAVLFMGRLADPSA